MTCTSHVLRYDPMRDEWRCACATVRITASEAADATEEDASND